MFLDYCHFTVAGVHLASAAIAQTVLTALFKLRCPIAEIRRNALAVDPRIEGEAHLLAAIHNANWGQSADIVGYHCARAIALSPAIDRLMNLFLDFHIRRLPSSLCRSFAEVCEMQSTSLVSLLFDAEHPIAEKFLNVRLIEQLRAALQASTPASHTNAEALLLAEHAVDIRDIDLLRKTYSVTSFHTLPNDSACAFYKACSPICTFRLVCRRPSSLRLTITYRQRGNTDLPGPRLSIGDQMVGELPPAKIWNTAELLVSAELLRPGVNVIEITWPVPDWDVVRWKTIAADALEAAVLPDINPIYGDIHRLQVSARSAIQLTPAN